MPVFMLFVLVVAAPVRASAQTVAGIATITGSVTDAAGMPLADATVTLAGASSRVAKTGANGSFEFPDVAAGDMRIVVTLPGFAPVTRTVRLAPGDMHVAAITLLVQVFEQTMVTADKTGERDAADTPLAMSVLAGADLTRTQAHTVEDIARQAPGVTFSQNTGFAQLTIRGIGTNAVFTGSDPSSAVYVDGVYLARPAMALGDLLNVERIEVLRGPQGTLYGRNVVGGALNIITRTPANDLQATARVVAGTSRTLRGDAQLSGPLVSGRVMGSIAVLRGVARGFVRDLDQGDQFLGGEDVAAARGKLRFLLHSRHQVIFSADVMRQDPTPLTYAKVLAVKPGFRIDNPADLHTVRTSIAAESRNLQYGGALQYVGQVTPRTTVTSLTAFRKLDYDVLVDTDITELTLTVSDTHEIHRQWSEELTIAHQRPGLSWIGGVYLFDDRDRQTSIINLGAPQRENRLYPQVDTTSKAAFAQATMDVTGRLAATAGLRYTRDDKAIRNEGRLLTLDGPVPLTAGSSYSYQDAIAHGAWTPKFALEVRHRESLLSYVSATRGFKSGGFNITSTEPGRGFAPEWAWSYEGGLKAVAAGGRARLNAAIFFTNYTNLQVQTAIRPGVLDISNAAAATITGLEVEAAAKLSDSWRAGGYINWLDSRYDRYVAVGVGGVTGDVAGHRLNNAPPWSGRAWVEWSRQLRGVIASVRPDVEWQSTVFFTPFNDAIQRQSPYALVNVSGEIRPRGGPWKVAVYARNLADQDHITGTFSSPPPAIGGRPGRSRQVGVTLTVQP